MLSDLNIGKYYCQGLQEFEFEKEYDCVWIQWVLCYLTDQDLDTFMKKCRSSLPKDKPSIVVVKENVVDKGFLVDKDDNSVMRNDTQFFEAFEKAGFQVLKHSIQEGFPEELHRISIYALKKAD